jgi:phosphomethylpyrimidine synthase
MNTLTSFAAIQARSTYHGSCKKYFAGSRLDLKGPFSEVSLSYTRHGEVIEQNAPLPLYDTSGPCTDPDARIDLARGLPPLRAVSIHDRPDTKDLIGPSSKYARLRADDVLAHLQRFPSIPRSRRSMSLCPQRARVA